MSETRIMGLYYSKPVVLVDAQGEAVQGRKGAYYEVGYPCEWGLYNVRGKVIQDISFLKDLNSFKVTFKGDPVSFIIIPYLADTEVCYDFVTKKEKK